MKRVITLWPIVPALIAFGLLAYLYNFIQDDAYISYRYVANFLNGDGLVYNVGERVEGFTNFGWVVYLILWGAAGFSFIAISELTGFAFGTGIVFFTNFITCELFPKGNRWPVWIAVYLVAVNQSLAYWSPAGLESSAFGFFAMLSFYLFLRRDWLLIWSLALAVWLRPEGAVVTGLIIVAEAIHKKGFPRFSLASAAIAFVVSLPFVIFKISYYGDILPNPFYAKTGFNLTQLSNGLEYAGRFFAHYGFYGAALILPLIGWRQLEAKGRQVLIICLLYIAYVVLVGGDVLKVHRFFVPVMGLHAALVAWCVWALIRRLERKTQYLLAFLISCGLLALTVWLPHKFVSDYNRLEKAFTAKMAWVAQNLKDYDQSDFSVALPTIGIFGYELIGHDIIDMVGLTDSTIARHSDAPIAGMASTWKEQKHNSVYLLTRAPDYVSFSTGIKPSAPAEKALMLYPQFTECYTSIGWLYRVDTTVRWGSLIGVFRKSCAIDSPFVPANSIEFVENYKLGLDIEVAGRHKEALEYYSKALQASREPYYVNLMDQVGFNLMLVGEHEKAKYWLNKAVAQDSLSISSHKNLYIYAVLEQDSAKAAIHARWLKELVPWYWPKVKEDAQLYYRQMEQLMKQSSS